MQITIEDDIGVTYDYELDDSKPLNICSCDVDGTLSSGVFYMDNGRIARQYNMRDGAGLRNLLKIPNTIVLLISGESDASIWNRATKLEIPFFHAPGRNKVTRFTKILSEFSQFETKIYHIGDDLNDYELLKISTIPAIPNNAHFDMQVYTRSVRRGFAGTVREWTDWLRDEIL